MRRHTLQQTFVFQLNSDSDDEEQGREDAGHLLSHVALNRSAKLLAAAMDNTINVFNLSQGNNCKIIIFL